MEYILFVVLAFYIYSKVQTKKALPTKKALKNAGEYSKSIRFDAADIPSNYQILFSIEVAGVHHRIEAAQHFMDGQNHSISLERELNNIHDKNAIKINGTNGLKSVHIGYVPKDLAKILVDGQWLDKINTRLMYAWVGYQNATVEVQILGPKEDVKKYKKHSQITLSKKDKREFKTLDELKSQGVITAQELKDRKENIYAQY